MIIIAIKMPSIEPTVPKEFEKDVEFLAIGAFMSIDGRTWADWVTVGYDARTYYRKMALRWHAQIPREAP